MWARCQVVTSVAVLLLASIFKPCKHEILLLLGGDLVNVVDSVFVSCVWDSRKSIPCSSSDWA